VSVSRVYEQCGNGEKSDRGRARGEGRPEGGQPRRAGSDSRIANGGTNEAAGCVDGI
jgi:hypothetical protein